MIVKLAETLAEMVPSAKALGVIVTLAVGAFMAGVGAVLGFGDYADLPEEVAGLHMQADSTEVGLGALRVEFDQAVVLAEDDRRRILCIVRLNATGVRMLASDLDVACP